MDDSSPLRSARANFQGYEVVDAEGRRRRRSRVIRGLGTLTLTPTELRFSRAVPAAEFTVALADVVDLEIGKGHNGKRVWRYPVLKVVHRDGDDVKVLGLIVGRQQEAESWLNDVRRAIAR